MCEYQYIPAQSWRQILVCVNWCSFIYFDVHWLTACLILFCCCGVFNIIIIIIIL